MNKLGRNLLSCVFVTGLLGSASVGAVPFVISGGSWSLGSGWGDACLLTVNCDTSHTSMNVSWALDGSLAQSFSLASVGDVFTLTFGSAVWSEEDNKIYPCCGQSSDETDNLDVTGILNISSPALSGTNNVGVVVASVGSTDDAANDLSVTFAPVIVNFGVGGQFQVDLSDPAWVCNPSAVCVAPSGESQTITAKFTLLALPTNPSTVPEPATLALLGLGLAGMAASRRRALN